MSRLMKVKEPGGWRHYLDGSPVHRGQGLELLLPGGVWCKARYETTGDDVTFYVPLGGDWESWQPPPDKRVGDVVYTDCRACNGTSRLAVGDRCPSCWGRRGGCESCSSTGTVQAASDCYACIEGQCARELLPPDPPMGLVSLSAMDLDRVVLRWPQR